MYIYTITYIERIYIITFILYVILYVMYIYIANQSRSLLVSRQASPMDANPCEP